MYILRALPKTTKETLFGFFHLSTQLAICEFLIPFEGNMVNLHLITSIYTNEHTFLGAQGIHGLCGDMYFSIEETFLAILIGDIRLGFSDKALVDLLGRFEFILVQFYFLEQFFAFSLANPFNLHLGQFRHFLNDKLQKHFVALCFGYIDINIVEHLIVPQLVNDTGKAFARDRNLVPYLKARSHNDRLCVVVLCPLDFYTTYDKLTPSFQGCEGSLLREAVLYSYAL